MVGVETPARSAICWSVIRLDPGFTRPFLPLSPLYTAFESYCAIVSETTGGPAPVVVERHL